VFNVPNIRSFWRQVFFSGNQQQDTETTQQSKNKNILECGPMPNLMAALPNIGGALCSTPQSLADAHY